MKRPVSESGYPFELGPAELGLARVGQVSAPLRGDVKVNAAQLQAQAGVVEDANPSYWDEEFATAHWGGLIAPPGMVQLWTLPQAWTPHNGSRGFQGAATEAPLPGDMPLLISTDSEYFEPVREGDRLTQTDTLIEVKPARRTPAGEGHTLVIRADYHNQHGVLVASVLHTLLRYGEAPA